MMNISLRCRIKTRKIKKMDKRRSFEERELIQKELDLRKGRLWEDPYAITEENWSRTDDFSDRPNWSQQLCSRISKERVKVHPPHTTVFGEEGDMSVLGDFTFHEIIYYFDHKVSYPLAKERMGRYFGPSTGVDNEMCSWVLKANGKVVARRIIRPLNTIEKNSEAD